MKKLIPIMIAAAMIIVVFAATDSGSEASLTGTYVNGNPASYGMTVDEPNAHWKYDSDGLTITGDSIFDGKVTEGTTSYCIYDPVGPLNIILDADLTITAYDDSSMNITLAIYSAGDINITGSGKLTIKHDGEGRIDQGLTAASSITIDGPTVEILSGADITASQAEWGSAFNMNSGKLNLIGSGTMSAENVYIRGGAITIDPSCGLIRNQISATSDHGAVKIEMTGGKISFANCTADDSIIIALGQTFTIDMHDAGGKNWEVDDYRIKAVNDGPVTIEIYHNLTFLGMKVHHDDMPVVVVISAITSIVVLGSIAIVYLRKH